MYTENLRQNEDIKQAKSLLTNISNRHNERYFYNDGHPRFSVIQLDSLLCLDVLERLIQRIETLEEQQMQKDIRYEVRKTRIPISMRIKMLNDPNNNNNPLSWLFKYFSGLFSR